MASTWASATSSEQERLRRPRAVWLLAAWLVCIAAAAPTRADDVYLEPETFVSEAFDGRPPNPAKLWIKPELNAQVKDIIGTALPALRMKYWRAGPRTAWILEAIGRDRPITAGYVVENGAIVRTAILVYRESRGAEVRHPFFTDQFKGATLAAGDQLDRPIDGITGATLSVHAISGLARVALLLDRAAQAAAP